MRIALGLEYDGSGFCGWQSQAGGGAVQDALEAALAVVADAPVRVVCAGRTDAGVHALAQVVHFDTEAVRPDTAWVRGVNAHLPASVAVRWAQPVGRFPCALFRARQALSLSAAESRRASRPDGASRRLVSSAAGCESDAQAAACCSASMIFLHFVPPNARPSRRSRPCGAAVARHGDLLVFDFEASAFLHHMVRNLVGTLVYVGKGRIRRHGSANSWRAGIVPVPRRPSTPAGCISPGSIMIRSGN
jgi:tRNA pseudouridine38-40 synthase